LPFRSPHFAAFFRILATLAGLFCAAAPLRALNPRKAVSQYTRTVWTQQQGLPQDSIRAIAQTRDGFLWLGTDEGLSRFDGYEFVNFTHQPDGLPSNSISALLADRDGSLWIGTSNGLTRYWNGKFTTYTTRDGLPDNVITALCQTTDGSLWIAAGVGLSRWNGRKFTNFTAAELEPLEAVRALSEDRNHVLWVSGYGGLLKRIDGKFVPVISSDALRSDIILTMLAADNGDIWIGGSEGLLRRSSSGALRLYTTHDGLPDNLVRALCRDRDGNLWVGTNGGLSRFENGRFAPALLEGGHERDWVRCLLEDREGNLWAGMNGGLNRFRDSRFTIFGRSEGLPSDQPLAVHQDRQGRIWVGFHDSGLVEFSPRGYKVYTTADGLAANEVFAIREAHNGDLLLATREGLCRMHDGRFRRIAKPDDLDRRIAFDVFEDASGALWVASPSGVQRYAGGKWETIAPGGALLNSASVVLSGGPGGRLWAGTYGEGLWRIDHGVARRLTTADGLGSNQIRSLLPDRDGGLWIGTYGGGLNLLRNGNFTQFTMRDGLLSDNVSHVEDDGRGSLWLSTTRGICRVEKAQLRDLAAGRIKALTPVNYGLDDGLRSAQCSPGYPTGAGGTMTSDGRLWFPTTRGLAVIRPGQKQPSEVEPLAHIVEASFAGGDIDLTHAANLPPGSGRIQFRYTGIYLSAPERVRYEYMLEGLDHEWVEAGNRRTINYNSLPHGTYRFLVRAGLAGGPWSTAAYTFELQPYFYERAWFLSLCGALVLAAVYGAYQLRLRGVRKQFSLVLEERVRLAREIHDTLAQGFVGISSQLDAVATEMPTNPVAASKHLDLARKMARHSVTEARRSVMDLRAPAVDEHDLPSALPAAARRWAAGSPASLDVQVSGTGARLPQEAGQNLMRIAQEAVTNAIKHAGAQHISVSLIVEDRTLKLSVCDDGCGFEPDGVFSALDGHFGLLGMRERAQRLGGELRLESSPGRGTRVEVRAPAP
jgi:signal transduction histidine kinase/ligand-binding sensor domain-containing protein